MIDGRLVPNCWSHSDWSTFPTHIVMACTAHYCRCVVLIQILDGLYIIDSFVLFLRLGIEWPTSLRGYVLCTDEAKFVVFAFAALRNHLEQLSRIKRDERFEISISRSVDDDRIDDLRIDDGRIELKI